MGKDIRSDKTVSGSIIYNIHKHMLTILKKQAVNVGLLGIWKNTSILRAVNNALLEVMRGSNEE